LRTIVSFLVSEHIAAGQSGKILLRSDNPATSDLGFSARSGHYKVDDVPLPICILVRSPCFIDAGRFQKRVSQLLRTISGKSKSCGKDARLVPATGMVEAKAIFTQLNDVYDGALAVR
jgi:hypothetical protein